jgi:hypothetical protein
MRAVFISVTFIIVTFLYLNGWWVTWEQMKVIIIIRLLLLLLLLLLLFYLDMFYLIYA